MRLVGLDVGDKRIGAATAETETGMAFPLRTVQRTGVEERDVAMIADLCRDEMADTVVVGLPVLESGEVGEQARKALAFAEALRPRVGVPVETIDERFSSWEAEGRLIAMNVPPKKRKERLDAAAAALILESYLAEKRRNTDGA